MSGSADSRYPHEDMAFLECKLFRDHSHLLFKGHCCCCRWNCTCVHVAPMWDDPEPYKVGTRGDFVERSLVLYNTFTDPKALKAI